MTKNRKLNNYLPFLNYNQYLDSNCLINVFTMMKFLTTFSAEKLFYVIKKIRKFCKKFFLPLWGFLRLRGENQNV